MAKLPVREDGWEQALLLRVREMLADTAARHSLRLEWSEDAPVELSCTLPQQPGLDFELWFAFSHDELTLGTTGDTWYADIFPLDDPEAWQRTCDAVDGLITGESRVLLYRAIGRKNGYWSVLQLRRGNRWRNISTGIGCAFPPVIRPTILRNGHTRATGHARPAWGSLLLLILLTGLAVRYLL